MKDKMILSILLLLSLSVFGVLSYDIASIGTNTTTIYNITNNITNNISTTYNITNNITTTFNVTNNITNNISTTYNITNNITNNITLQLNTTQFEETNSIWSLSINWLTGFINSFSFLTTESDPITSPLIISLNNTKLNLSDQRYNDTSLIDLKANLTGANFTGLVEATALSIVNNMTIGKTTGEILFGNGGGYSWNSTDSCLVSPANSTNARSILCVTKPLG
jgi:hypothetical protein